MSGFNMPPGVNPRDIPGNEPDDDGEYRADAVLTLRDYFAAAALAGSLEQGTRDNMDCSYWHAPSVVAKRAYAIADAMLKERQK